MLKVVKLMSYLGPNYRPIYRKFNAPTELMKECKALTSPKEALNLEQWCANRGTAA